MWILLAACLILCGPGFALRCPDGLECEGPHSCCRHPGGDGYACCDQPQFPGVSLHMLPPSALNESSGVACPDGTTCPPEYSCLRTLDASYGCCPWGEAVSCADSHHCCPRGFHCSADGHSCFQSQGDLPPSTVEAVQCPDGESQCPNESTCCLMADGSWGCCPIPEASCCADKIHCCPHATTCDMAHARCSSASGGEQPLRTKFPARKRVAVLALSQKNICPNNESTCPDTATCCSLLTGQYGCCPLQNAVCCSDHLHCCPQGTTCDLTHSKCTLTPGRSWPITRLLVDLQKAPAIQCDAGYKCPDGNTCCQQSSGDWGCCPLEEAVCCSDHVHCCPKGFSCHPAEGTCVKGIDSISWLAKSSAEIVRVVAASAGSVVPCDAQTACPDGQTCCRLQTGAWGCCPFPQAVCCPDHLHCCPSGFRCGQRQDTCVKDGESIPWLEKRPAIVHITASSGDVRCDDQVSCPDGNTCCRMASGEWGCCPLPQAVCCPDHAHCCPNGFRCGSSPGTCVKDGEVIPWLEKRPAVLLGARSPSSSGFQLALAPAGLVRCDNQVSCPDGNTCCRLASGAWGCCPLPQAVCCPDHAHCCPNGFRCGSSPGTCVKDGEVIPWLEKRPAVLLGARSPSSPGFQLALAPAGLVRCDNQVSCPDGNTCCRLASGAWGCCPLPQAVCCPDHAHCCPSGFRCGPSAGTCVKDREVIPWLEKRPAVAHGARSPSSPGLWVAPAAAGLVKCDDQVSCPDGNTCCRLSSGAWGCCPFAQAVCCTDHVHCCPNGYTCDAAQSSCQESGHGLTWGPKHLADLLQNRDVRCDDTTSCAEGQTCCKSKAGTWSCCQLPNAVCCADHQHCCPSGYTCNLKAQTCEKQQPQSPDAKGGQPSVSLSPSRPAVSGRDVPCDAQHYCHDRQTCCQASTGAWACCPYNKGSCCSDKRHCCPSGFRCSSSGLQCLRKGPLRWDADVFSSHSKEALPLL